MSSFTSTVTSSFLEVGLFTGAGAILAAVTSGPLGWTALAFCISELVQKIFALTTAFIGDRESKLGLRFCILLASRVILTAIFTTAMVALGLIGTPGIVVMSVIGALPLLCAAVSIAQLSKDE